MVLLCPPGSCRHATISRFFGNKAPNCAGACDFCRNPKMVRAQLERAAALSTKTEAQSAAPRGAFGFQPDLYEGGKKGYGFERQERPLNSPFGCTAADLTYVAPQVRRKRGRTRRGGRHQEEEGVLRALQEADGPAEGEPNVPGEGRRGGWGLAGRPGTAGRVGVF